MTKKISLSEAKKLATNSLLYADGSDLYDRDGDCLFVSTDFDKPSHDKETATAALLAHSMNIRDELIEALEIAIELANMSDDEYEHQPEEDPTKALDAVLMRAKTVKMP